MKVYDESQLVLVGGQKAFECLSLFLGESIWSCIIDVAWILVSSLLVNMVSFVIKLVQLLEIYNVVNLSEINPEIPIEINTSLS